VVAGCGVLALVLSTIGVYGMIADTRQIRMRSIWSSAMVSVVRSCGTRPCRQSWQRWRGSLDLEGRRWYPQAVLVATSQIVIPRVERMRPW